MSDVKIYRTKFCRYCDMAERLLEKKGADFHEVDLTNDPETRRELTEETGMQTVPQIFIDGDLIGGYDELRALDQEGELEELLADAGN